MYCKMCSDLFTRLIHLYSTQFPVHHTYMAFVNTYDINKYCSAWMHTETQDWSHCLVRLKGHCYFFLKLLENVVQIWCTEL